ncbi:hypothetical protein FQZ97_1200520 [compost metagenome]
MAILQRKAELGRDIEPPGSCQERFGMRLAQLVVAMGDDHRKAVEQPVKAQVSLDIVMPGRCCDRKGNAELLQGADELDHAGLQLQFGRCANMEGGRCLFPEAIEVEIRPEIFAERLSCRFARQADR